VLSSRWIVLLLLRFVQFICTVELGKLVLASDKSALGAPNLTPVDYYLAVASAMDLTPVDYLVVASPTDQNFALQAARQVLWPRRLSLLLSFFLSYY